MAKCAKCGTEIEDGKDLCENCDVDKSAEGESYLDQLLGSVSDNPESQEAVEVEQDEMPVIEEEPLNTEDTTQKETGLEDKVENGEDISELLGLLSEHYDEEEKNVDTAMGMDDVFKDALSAVSYMENEREEEISEPASMEEKSTSMEEKPTSVKEGPIEEEPVSTEGESISMEDDAMSIDMESMLSEAELSQLQEQETELEQDEVLPDDLSHLLEQTLAGEETDYIPETQDEGEFALDDLFGLGGEEESAELSEPLETTSELMEEHSWEDQISEEEVPEEQPEPEAEAPKKSFFKRIKGKYFDNIVDDAAIAKEKAEAEAEAKAVEEMAEKKKEKEEQAAKSKEEAEAKKEEEQERKKLEKEAKAAEAAKKKEEKLAAKKKRQEEEEKQFAGRVNPVGAAIVFLFFTSIGIVTFFGMQSVSHKSYITSAEAYYDTGNYMKAYSELAGVQLSESEQKVYDRARVLATLQQKLDACDEYLKMKLPLQALNSLVNGVKKYDKMIEEAEELEVKSEADKIQGQIGNKLREEFKMTVAEARQIIRSETADEYTNKLKDKVATLKFE